MNKYTYFFQRIDGRVLQFINKMVKFTLTKIQHTMQNTDELVVIAEYNTSMEAELAKSVITSAGIHVEIRNGYMANVYPGVIPSQLLVSEKDREQAEILLHLRQ